MAVTKAEKTRALAVLTSAALGLPGIQVEAATPIGQAEANVQYGYYQESDDRMEVDIYHADYTIPLTDRFDISFSIDRDTYTGATPTYSLPDVTSIDIVTAASGGATAPFDMTAQYLLACNPANPGCKIDATEEEARTNAYYFGLREDATSTFVRNKINEFGGGRPGLLGYIGWIRDLDNQRVQQLATDSAVMNALLNQPVTGNARTRQALTHQPRETRTMPVFSANIYFDNVTLGFSGGLSDEPDFFSRFGSAKIDWELNDKLTTLSFGYSLTDNDIFRSAPAIDDDGIHNHGAVAGDFSETSTFNQYNWGVSHVLAKNTLLQMNGSYALQKGYLSNPYKLVNIRGEISGDEYSDAAHIGTLTDWSFATELDVVGLDLFREVRPRRRNQWSFSTQLNQYIPQLDAAAHLRYQFYTDDWGINSHTLEFKWYQSLPMGIKLIPNIRYYSQSQAQFFAPYFLAPRADGNYSSDFRLSSFGAISGGLTVSKEFAKGIKLETGFEYYVRQGDLGLSSGADTTYADYDFYMLHANLNVNLGAVSLRGGNPHSQHMQHSAPVPAGVKFAQMMPNAGDFMVGYQYAYSNQQGDMMRGSSVASNNALINKACGSSGCAARPSDMRMDMHMLNIMYAPTDWLNLMLMPQIMDMRMSLVDLPDALRVNEHGSGHSSGGLGDTLGVALFKLYDQAGHHIHLGLGVSAPTGDVDVTLDGFDDADSIPQDYGMQLGSGTWDLHPSLTYTGQMDRWSWGAQVTGIKRMQDRNSAGYALGDMIQSSLWGGVSVYKGVSLSVRGQYTDQGGIKGGYTREHLDSTPVDFTENYGGHYWDIGLGIDAVVPSGALGGHHFALEWLQPVAEHFDGYQLEREGTLSVNWSFMF